MINAGHAIIYSRNAEADRGFLRDILKFPYVDVGQIYQPRHPRAADAPVRRASATARIRSPLSALPELRAN